MPSTSRLPFSLSSVYPSRSLCLFEFQSQRATFRGGFRRDRKTSQRGFLGHRRSSSASGFSPTAALQGTGGLRHACAVGVGKSLGVEQEEIQEAAPSGQSLKETPTKTNEHSEETWGRGVAEEQQKEDTKVSQRTTEDESEGEIACSEVSEELTDADRQRGVDAHEALRGGAEDASERKKATCSQSTAQTAVDGTPNLPRTPPRQKSSTYAGGGPSEGLPSLPSRVYSSIPEVVAPPGRAFPFPLPQLSSRLTGVPAAAKPPSKRPASLPSSSPYSPSVPPPSYLRLLPHYPRVEPAPVDDGLLEEIFSARTREEVHQSLEKLPHSVYTDWLLTPHRFRDSDGFLASTDPPEFRQRFADVYVHQQEQLRQRLFRLRSEPGRSVTLPRLSQEEKNRLLRLKIPARFVLQRPERLEKREIPLEWKGGGLVADRELIDAGGPGGFVRSLEAEGWAALFPSFEDYEELKALDPGGARRRLEIATRMQARAWREDRRASERIDEEIARELARRAKQKEQRRHREDVVAGQRTRVKDKDEEGGRDDLRERHGNKEPRRGQGSLSEGFQSDLGQEMDVAGEVLELAEGTEEAGKKRLSPNVQAAAEALMRQQLLVNIGVPSSVQALMARYGHITPDSPAMPMSDARSALQVRFGLMSLRWLRGPFFPACVYLPQVPETLFWRSVVPRRKCRVSTQGIR